MSYYFYGGPHLRNTCPDLKPWFNRGLIYINGMGNITLGPWRRNINAPLVVFPSRVDRKEYLNSLIHGPSKP